MNKELTYNQVMNLIYFTVMMKSDTNIIDKDPKYILEKWDRYIGINPLSLEIWNESEHFLNNSEYDKYVIKWRVSDEELKSIDNILKYLYALPSFNIIGQMVKIFNICINNSNVREDCEYESGSHPLLSKHINRILMMNTIKLIWITLKEIER